MHFNFLYLMHCKRIAYVPKPLYHYNLTNNGVTLISSPLTARKLTSLKAYEKTLALVREYGDPELEHIVNRALFDRYLNLVYAYYYNRTNSPEMIKEFCRQLQILKGDFFPNDCYSRQIGRAHV